MIPIDFSQITHAAERRTNNLKDLQTLMLDLPDVLAAAQQVLNFLNSVDFVWKALDAEGQQMLPMPVQQWMQYRTPHLTSACSLVGDANNGLTRLASAAGDQP